MISKNSGSVAYALYKMGVDADKYEVKKYIDFYQKDDFL